jgi:hypothetical protein
MLPALSAGIPGGFDWNNWLGPLQERPYDPEIYSRRDPEGMENFQGVYSQAGCQRPPTDWTLPGR